MPRVGLEPTIPIFELAKTVHDLYRAATVNGTCNFTLKKPDDFSHLSSYCKTDYFIHNTLLLINYIIIIIMEKSFLHLIMTTLWRRRASRV
jgi:hypothetical protein